MPRLLSFPALLVAAAAAAAAQTAPPPSLTPVDYPAFINANLSKGVTPDNNAFVVLLKALGTTEDVLGPEHAQIAKLAGAPESPGLYVPPPKELCDPNGNLLDLYLTAPWKAADHPAAAIWLTANTPFLAALHEASTRPRYWFPLVIAPGKSLIPAQSLSSRAHQWDVQLAKLPPDERKNAEAQLAAMGLATPDWNAILLSYQQFMADFIPGKKWSGTDGNKALDDWLAKRVGKNAKDDLGETDWSVSLMPRLGETRAQYADRFAANVEALTLPSLGRVSLQLRRGNLQRDMMQIAAALEMYRKDKLAYPATLDALVPGYVAKVPLDLDGTALHYSPENHGYRLESMGGVWVDFAAAKAKKETLWVIADPQGVRIGMYGDGARPNPATQP